MIAETSTKIVQYRHSLFFFELFEEVTNTGRLRYRVSHVFVSTLCDTTGIIHDLNLSSAENKNTILKIIENALNNQMTFPKDPFIF